MRSAICLYVFCMLLFTLPGACQPYTIDTFDIAHKNHGDDPRGFTIYKNDLYFFADTTIGYSGATLMRMSGNYPERILHPSLNDFLYAFSDEKAIVCNDKLYYISDDTTREKQLYIYDSMNPVVKVTGVFPTDFLPRPRELAQIGKNIYLTMTVGSDAHLFELNTDSNKLRNLSLENKSGGKAITIDDKPAVYNNKLYFAGSSPVSGDEIFYYDPIGDTIQVLAEMAAGSLSSNPHGLAVLDGNLYFAADSTHNYRNELYYYNGNTIRQATYFTGREDILYGSLYSGSICFYKGRIIFPVAQDSTVLYSYDPKTDSVKNLGIVHHQQNSAAVQYFTEYNGKLFFNCPHGATPGLWVYDNATPPHLFTFPGMTGLRSNEMMVYKDALYVNAYLSGPQPNTGIGYELFRITDSFIIPPPTQHVTNSVSLLSATLYPNPTTQDAYLDVHLKDAQTMQVLVTDVQGRIVYRNNAQLYSAGEHTIHLPIKQLPTGGYIYHISNEQGILLQSGKLMKE